MSAGREDRQVWSEVGKRIRLLRRSQGISVDSLAKEVGVVRQQIVRLEAGVTGTPLPRLLAIARILGADIGDLIAPGQARGATDPHQALLAALRIRGLAEEEMAKVVEYVRLLELGREHDLT